MTALPEPAPSRWRWLFYASGLAMGGYGVWGELFGSGTDAPRWIVLVVVAALGHDLVLVPLVLACAFVVRRALPTRSHSVLQGAGLVSLVLVLVALPGIGRYGARPDNTSILPRDYGAGLAVALTAVAAVAAVLLVLRLRRRPAPLLLTPPPPPFPQHQAAVERGEGERGRRSEVRVNGNAGLT